MEGAYDVLGAAHLGTNVLGLKFLPGRNFLCALFSFLLAPSTTLCVFFHVLFFSSVNGTTTYSFERELDSAPYPIHRFNLSALHAEYIQDQSVLFCPVPLLSPTIISWLAYRISCLSICLLPACPSWYVPPPPRRWIMPISSCFCLA